MFFLFSGSPGLRLDSDLTLAVFTAICGVLCMCESLGWHNVIHSAGNTTVPFCMLELIDAFEVLMLCD